MRAARNCFQIFVREFGNKDVFLRLMRFRLHAFVFHITRLALSVDVYQEHDLNWHEQAVAIGWDRSLSRYIIPTYRLSLLCLCTAAAGPVANFARGRELGSLRRRGTALPQFQIQIVMVPVVTRCDSDHCDVPSCSPF